MSNSKNNKFHPKITLLSLFLLFSTLVVNSYNPDYTLAINCGTSANTTAYNRTWVGDSNDNSNIFSFIEPKTTGSSLTPQPNSLSSLETPFTTARISLSNFTYSFSSITSSPVFIRLHFYSTSYNYSFEPSNAVFSVIVNNNLTLLKNFNPYLWLHDDDEEKITKEYCIQIEPSENLNITFIPNDKNQSNVYYAFINGIEVVSLPSFLYYTDLDDTNYHFNLLGFDNSANPYQIRSDKALEMVYRVNVGGTQVPANDDTGMFRYWDNDFYRYLQKRYPQSESSDFSHHLNYLHNTIPNYTAPEIVYITGRSYGMYETENFNVTWNFEVDSAFTYMVRLHFCEFDYHMKNKGDRVFQIFLNDVMAEQGADVIYWSGAPLVPVHKDYAVIMNSQEGNSQIERVNLSIKLQRAPQTIYTKYLEVLLNGIEIFKVSDGSNNLAGLNPKYLSPKEPVLSNQPPKSKKSHMVMVVAVGVSCLFLAFAVVGTIVFVRRRRRFESHTEMEESSWKTRKESSSTLPSHLCRYFTIAEIRAATNNFDDIFIIGVGGFGDVYKGYIDGATPVAIKRLKSGSQQGENEFLNEIELLSQLRHNHLVSLIGYCNDGAEMILVYDFMQRGTLREYLYGSDSGNEPLTWKQRLEILLGAARGLHYLHAGAKHTIIHRDVKSTNILLDEKWVAKVSDFGLSKVGPTGTSMTHVSTVVKGSLGYLDPEYYLRQRLTLKSDVYSFGVVLLEVLCARPPLIRTLDKKNVSLVVRFQRCYNEGVIIEEMVDPFIKDSITDECLRCYCQMALSCLHDDGSQRMSMSDVVGALEFALQLEMTQEKEKSEQRIQYRKFASDDGNEMRFTTSSGDYGSHTSKVSTISATSEDQPLFSTDVFSEVGYPKAR